MSSSPLRRAGAVLGVTSLAALAFTGVASAASTNAASTANPYSPAYGHPYRHGVLPTIGTWEKMNAYAAAHPDVTAATGPQTLSYGGGIDGIGVQSGRSKVYVVFYGTQWGTLTTDANGNAKFSNDSAGAAGVTQQMFKGIGTNGERWSADLTQWCDGAGVATDAVACPATGASYIPWQYDGVLAGVWYDNSVASPSAATGHQLGQEAVKAAAHFGNTTAVSNRYAYYVIISPHGTNPDNYQGQYCAWHDYNGDPYLTGGAVSSPYGDIAFSNQPYNIDSGAGCGVGFVNSPGTTDGYTITLGHEWHEMMSDQNPAGGWTNHTTGQENSDECAWISPGQPGGVANVSFGSFGTYAEQASWSNDTNTCAISHPIVNRKTTPCGELSCTPAQGAYNSHFTGVNCTGTESYYTPYFNSDGVRRSWDGQGTAGTVLRTVTNRSYRSSDGVCHDAWPDGNTLSGFVTIYRWPCGEARCTSMLGLYNSHFTGAGCTGTESYYTPYFHSDGVRRSWDGQGSAGTVLRTMTNRSYRSTDGVCHDAWPNGNTVSGFVTIYRSPCGEATCSFVQAAYNSHFTGAGCTGTESYYTPSFNSDGVRRSWDGQGYAGTVLRTVTIRSYRSTDGVCHDAWPDGNTLSGFVTIYRPPCGEATCTLVQGAYNSHFTGAGCTGTESYYTPYFNSDGVRRSWDGQGYTGTILRTVTNRSYRSTDGICHDAWPDGNTLDGFVTIYR